MGFGSFYMEGEQMGWNYGMGGTEVEQLAHFPTIFVSLDTKGQAQLGRTLSRRLVRKTRVYKIIPTIGGGMGGSPGNYSHNNWSGSMGGKAYSYDFGDVRPKYYNL